MRPGRAGLLVLLFGMGLALPACSSFDPSEWFNTKKPLPGERRAVFPEGVPGVAQGVPADLVEGYQPPAEPVPEPLPVESKPKPKPKPKQAAAPRPPQQQPAQSESPFPNPPPR